jgi:U3 small nucleolar RNA-associated protein 12
VIPLTPNTLRAFVNQAAYMPTIRRRFWCLYLTILYSAISKWFHKNAHCLLQIRLWNLNSWDCDCAFAGHRGAVTALRFSSSGAHLASGSQDTDIVLWDVSGESGLFRLKGHRGQITDVAFLGGSGAGRLVSSSKDETIKVWDLDAQHCCQTVASRSREAWSLDVDPTGSRLAVGASDAELRVFWVDITANTAVLHDMGSLKRATAERVATVRYAHSPDGSTLLVCQGAGKVTEVWRVRDEAEAKRRLKRRKRRKREKAHKKGDTDDAGVHPDPDPDPLGEAGNGGSGKGGRATGKRDVHGDEDDFYLPGNGPTTVQAHAGDDTDQDAMTAVDELELVATIRSKHKVSSCAVCFSAGRRAPPRLVLSLANNSLEVWDFRPGEDPSRSAAIDGPGHRSDVRALALASDDATCLSTSNSGIKIWNPRNGACLRSVESGYGLCGLFAPGNKHAVVGTKEGRLEIVDVSAGVQIAAIEAHSGPVWSIAALPDGSGIVSGSADKDVKFWEWEVQQRHEDGGKQLGLVHVRSLTMTDDVLCVRLSPDSKFLGIALLDSTVRVFFQASLKFFLSLYGHKLPVLSMDISSDGTLLATGSADKNLKIWGLDFGDCHRSLFAHNDSVMSVAFVPGTHYIFTAGKDGVVKYWDADKFEQLLTLEGHHSEIWALAVSSLGDYVITGSHDRSLRRWERTEEPFFIEEERERRLDSLFEEEVDAVGDRRPLGPDGTVVEIGEEGAVGVAGRKTTEVVNAVDSIVEALDMAAAEEERTAEPRPPPPNPLLLGLSPADYVLHVLGQVRGSELEQALVMMPFTDALRLLGYLATWLKTSPRVELLCRASVLLMKVHMQQLMATPAARPLLGELRNLLRGRVQAFKDTMGFNAAALQHLSRMVGDGRPMDPTEVAVGAIAELKKRKAETVAS